MSKITLEQTQKLFDMLQGGELDGMTLAEQPKLSARAAFSVIYYLQEELGIIPDTYEACAVCGELYDADCDGHVVSEDTIDGWYEENGISLSAIKKHEGAHVCSEECEYDLLIKQEIEK
jgi:hypothetical protein